VSLRPYPVYEDCPIEPVGAVPRGWKVVPLKRVAAISYGLGQPPVYCQSGLPFVRATNVNRGVLSKEGLVYVDQATLPPSRIVRLRVGDIIVVRSGAYTGDSAFVTSEWSEAVAGFDMVVRCSEDVSSRFVATSLLSNYVLDGQIGLSRMRAAQPHLNAEELGKVLLVLPPQTEQLAINKFLDRETGKIDALVAEQERLIALLKEKRQAVISQAVTKGLDPGVPMKPSGVEWLGEVPAHWELRKLKFLGEAIIGLTYSPADIVAEGAGTLVLRSSNVQGGKIVFDDNVFVSFSIPEELMTRIGDILICSRNGSRALIGKNAVIDASSASLTFGAFMTIFRSQHSRYIACVLTSVRLKAK
jgi:type I restriction enzyme, S subunit